MKTRRAALIYNPMAGALQRNPAQLDRLIPALRESGIEVAITPTSHAGHATELVSRAVMDEVETVIVCGGDGTINEAAQPLVGTETALAIWPCGTANVLARELGLPATPRAFARLIASETTRHISVGLAARPAEAWQRYFLLMAGIGLDARIVDDVDLGLKRFAGKAAYLASGLNYITRMPQTPFTLNFNGASHHSTFAVISNAANYAVWFKLAPQARLEDDKLDVCLFNTNSRLAYLSYALLSALGGRHTNAPGVCYQASRAIHANSPELTHPNAARVQLDGEVVGQLPMEFQIVPAALRVVAPAAC